MLTSSLIICLVGKQMGECAWLGWHVKAHPAGCGGWKRTCPTVSLPPEDFQIKVKRGQMFWKSNRVPCSPTEGGQMAGPWSTGQKARKTAEDSCSSLASGLTISRDVTALGASPWKEFLGHQPLLAGSEDACGKLLRQGESWLESREREQSLRGFISTGHLSSQE